MTILATATLLLTNAQQVCEATLLSRGNMRFDITGTVISPGTDGIRIQDASGAIRLQVDDSLKNPLVNGDRVRATGITCVYDQGIVLARCQRIERLSFGAAVLPTQATLADIATGRCDNRYITARGTIREVFQDEIEPTYIYFTLTDGDRIVYSTHRPRDGRLAAELAALTDLTDAEVIITGYCSPCDRGYRRMIGRTVTFQDLTAIQVVRPAPTDPFAVPTIDDLRHFSPSEIRSMGRRRAVGMVIAVCNTGCFYLRSANRVIRKITPIDAILPEYGDFVEVSGLPETDLYRINLTNARWRPAHGIPEIREKPPVRKTADELLANQNGLRKIDISLHGNPIIIRGKVLDISSAEPTTGRILLQCGKFSIPVDAASNRKALDGITIGCELDVSGTCIVEAENWKVFSTFPHTTGISIVLRTPDDIRVISRPPWWTPGRLLVVVGSLLAALLGIIIWNRILNRLVERRSRELLREQAGRVGDRLKVGERTRLAVELHDSLSQTLTGVAMKINAANRALPPDGAVARGHLDLAARTLASCRNELKNCLWDLRNNALEDADMAEAVRRIVTPHIGDATLSVRFAALRDRFTESTAHALLRIIRELATNAVRHGHASHVQIAGVVENRKLMISVRDDGCGFDVASAPGMELGHFGLEGIRERLREFDGTLEIESSPKGGTRAVVAFTLPSEDIS